MSDCSHSAANGVSRSTAGFQAVLPSTVRRGYLGYVWYWRGPAERHLDPEAPGSALGAV